MNERLTIRARAAFLQYMGLKPGAAGNQVWDGLKASAREHWTEVISASDAAGRETDTTQEVALDPRDHPHHCRCPHCKYPSGD
jgi:hypothetical protein